MATLDELRAKITRAGPWFEVECAALPSRCRKCDATIYFVRTAAQRWMPVDCDVEGGVHPVRRTHYLPGAPGRGVSHFATCPSAAQFRR